MRVTWWDQVSDLQIRATNGAVRYPKLLTVTVAVLYAALAVAVVNALTLVFVNGSMTRHAREACASIGATLREGREFFCVMPDGTLKVLPGNAMASPSPGR